MSDKAAAERKFTQITATVQGGEILLYALDASGDVWRFDDKTRQWVMLPRRWYRHGSTDRARPVTISTTMIAWHNEPLKAARLPARASRRPSGRQRSRKFSRPRERCVTPHDHAAAIPKPQQEPAAPFREGAVKGARPRGTPAPCPTDVRAPGASGRGRSGLTVRDSGGAEGGTRTPTPLRALDPESSASANSATSAPSRR